MSLRIDDINAGVLLPLKGFWPLAISWSTTPRLKMSARWSTASSSSCSGDM